MYLWENGGTAIWYINETIMQMMQYTSNINENCEIPVEALKELSEVMSNLENAFSNAGFVLPYNELEETGIE